MQRSGFVLQSGLLQQSQVNLFDEVVAALVKLIDRMLHGSNGGVGRIRASGRILLVPKFVICPMLVQNERGKAGGGLRGATGVPLRSGVVLQVRDFDRMEHRSRLYQRPGRFSIAPGCGVWFRIGSHWRQSWYGEGMEIAAESGAGEAKDPAQVRILVVGPIWLERYIRGELAADPDGIPVLRASQRFDRPSGAANVALGIAALGCQPFLCGYWSQNAEQETLAALLENGGVDTLGVVSAAHSKLPRTGFYAGERPLLWLEMEGDAAGSPEDAVRLEARAVELAGKVHAVVLAEQAEDPGMLSAELCGAILRAARTAGVPVVAHAVAGDLGRYSGAAVVLLNRTALAQATGADGEDGAWLEAARVQRAEHELEHLVVLGDGLTVIGASEPLDVQASAGIGKGTAATDALLAVFAVAAAQGQTPEATAARALQAAATVARKFGRSPLSAGDLAGDDGFRAEEVR